MNIHNIKSSEMKYRKSWVKNSIRQDCAKTPGCPTVWGHTGSQPGPWDQQQNHVRGLHVGTYRSSSSVMQRGDRPGRASKVRYKICKSIFNLTGSQTWSDVIVSPQTRTRSSCCSLNQCGEVWLKPERRALQQTSCGELKIRMSHRHFSIIFQEITNRKIQLCFATVEPDAGVSVSCGAVRDKNPLSIDSDLTGAQSLKVRESERPQTEQRRHIWSLHEILLTTRKM